MVSLRPLSAANRQAVEALRVSPQQGRFVSGVAASLAEAAEHPRARALYWGVYADDTPVGFVMIADEVDDLIVEYFRGRPGVEVLTTSAGQGDGSPIAFYERYGFERTGELHGDEVVLRLTLP